MNNSDGIVYNTTHGSSNTTQMLKNLMFFFGTVVVGTLVANLLPDNYIKAVNIWGEDYILNYINKYIEYKTCFEYALSLRIRTYVAVFIIMCSPFVKKSGYVLVGYVGLLWGIMSSFILMQYGINGLRICFFLVFPHYVFYVMAVIMTYIKLLRVRKSAKNKPDWTIVAVIILSVGCIIAGSMCEAWVNSEIMRKILMNFLK